MGRLYICEKPSQARNVASALGGARASKGLIETRQGTVTHAFGHLFELLSPNDYKGTGWDARWSLAQLPMVPDPFRFALRGDAAGQFKVIRQLLGKASEVVIASDPDREGEAIVRNVLREAGYRGPTKRLWFNGEDANSIKKALARLKPGAETEPLYRAQMARDRADWLVGMNCTRAASCAFGAPGRGALHIGRVVTPTLWLVVNRDREIKNFNPEDYFELVAAMDSRGKRFSLFHAPAREARIKTRAEAEKKASQAEGAAGPLSVKTEAKRQAPRQPFTLPALQKRANRIWGWSAEKTLGLAQKLYEAKLTTYPRTDCPYLSDDQWDEVPATLAHLSSIDELEQVIASFEPERRSRVFNSKKVEAHSGLIPTLEAADLGKLSADERRLYMLIARNYTAALMPDYEYLSTRISFDANGVEFWTTGQIPTRLGWRAAFTHEEEDRKGEAGESDGAPGEADLPDVKDGDPACVLDVEILAKQTKPPAHYTEATLLADMENVGKFVEDARLKKILKENAGIGTPATRDSIIKKLRDPKNGYVQVTGRKLIATGKGVTFIEALEKNVPELVDPGVTALWEDALEKIARGEGEMLAFVEKVARNAARQVEAFSRAAGSTMVAGGVTRGGGTAARNVGPLPGDGQPCPSCGEGTLKTFVSRKTGNPFLGCSNYKDGCKHIESGGKVFHKGKEVAPAEGDGKPCPKCKTGVMRTRVSAKGTRFLGCSAWKPDGKGCDEVEWLSDGRAATEAAGKPGPGRGSPRSRHAAAPASAGIDPLEGDGKSCPKCRSGKLRTRVAKASGRRFLGCDRWKPDGKGCDHLA